jgi:hypothetical protein
VLTAIRKGDNSSGQFFVTYILSPFGEAYHEILAPGKSNL